MALLDSIDRRRFLKALASAGATGALAPQALLAETKKAPAWQNWSGNQSADPANLVFATSEAQLRQTLRDSTGTIRPFGGSHSFSAVVPSDDTLVMTPGDGTPVIGCARPLRPRKMLLKPSAEQLSETNVALAQV